MKNRLRLIRQAILDRPILSGITFIDIPYFEAEDLIVRNCIFPKDTVYTAVGTGEVNWPIERIEGRTIKPHQSKLVGCFATGSKGKGGLT